MSVITKNLIDAAVTLGSSAKEIETTAIGFSMLLEVVKSQPEIFKNILFYLLIIFINIVLNISASVFSTYLNEKFEFYIRKKMYSGILKTKWIEITQYHSGDLLTRLTSDVSSVSSGILNTFSAIITLIINFVASFATLMYFDSSLALFALALAPIAMLSSVFFAKKIKFYQTGIKENETVYRSFMQENITNISVVKSFGAEDEVSERLSELYEKRINLVVKGNRLSTVMSSVLGLTYSLGYLGALTWGIIKISLKMTTYGTLSVFLGLISRIQSPLVGLARTIPSLTAIFASAARIIEIEELQREEYKKVEINAKSMGINFIDVDFSYNNNRIFQDFNINIKPGAIVAITGSSGVGKTTFIRLIMNYIDVQKGKITYEYTDERGDTVLLPSAPAIRKYVSYVPQGNTLFSGSIKENLLFGNQDLTSEEMYDILKTADISDYVRSLPNGIDTIIGEKGHGLSEGQAQRISIARALAKKSPLIIFDEATAALDEPTEFRIVKNIKKLKDRPTCILITHRREIIPLLDEEINIKK